MVLFDQLVPRRIERPLVVLPATDRAAIDRLAHLCVRERERATLVLLRREHALIHLKTHAGETSAGEQLRVLDQIFVDERFVRESKGFQRDGHDLAFHLDHLADEIEALGP